jgi:hypothetical protein
MSSMMGALAARVAAGATVQRVQISNHRGRVNGWTTHERVYGICLAVEGRPRPGATGKVRAMR